MNNATTLEQVERKTKCLAQEKKKKVRRKEEIFEMLNIVGIVELPEALRATRHREIGAGTPDRVSNA